MAANISTSFYNDIRQILKTARSRAYAAVNTAMVDAYWMIGKRIVEEEQHGKERAGYGQELIKNLSKELQSEFGKGFSVANPKNFRQFYLTFAGDEKSYTLCSQLSWSHIRLIMRIDNEKARTYYLTESKAENWSVRKLQRNINSSYYERLLSSSDKNSEAVPDLPETATDRRDFIKDPYVLEFLNLPEDATLQESRFEQAIISNLQAFLLEMGKGFSFVARQFRISTETSHFYIDLVFYNYLLKCFVIIDLKTGKLTHQDIGQMDMYVRMFDDLKTGEDDNPTIGIILCGDKEETVVRYSVNPRTDRHCQLP
jgi:predicted nuclease of restriction endonuclease-like (RecB) superfamily